MKKTSTVLEAVNGTGSEFIIFNKSEQFYRKPLFNPYYFLHGRSEYLVDTIVFYDETGIRFMNTTGWLTKSGSNNDYKSMGFYKDGEEVKLKRKLKLDYTKNELYFLPKGTDWTGENRAWLYVPMAYLDNESWELHEAVAKGEFQTTTSRTLVTPSFNLFISTETDRDFETAKASFMAELEHASDKDELESVIKRFKHKF